MIIFDAENIITKRLVWFETIFVAQCWQSNWNKKRMCDPPFIYTCKRKKVDNLHVTRLECEDARLEQKKRVLNNFSQILGTS